MARRMENLNDIQKQFYYNQNLEREINNGGFNLYFSNSSGNFAHQTIESLLAIGANSTANILKKAIDQFPNHIVPEDRNERNTIITQMSKTAGAVWEALDNDFYVYDDDLNALNMGTTLENILKCFRRKFITLYSIKTYRSVCFYFMSWGFF